MKKKLISVLLCTAVAASLAAGCSAGNGSDPQEAESGETSEEKVIRVACEATTPGWIQTDEDGNLSGYDYDVWTEMANVQAMKLTIRLWMGRKVDYAGNRKNRFCR